jgi:PPP family 3-phenylpropionic acid transporter
MHSRRWASIFYLTYFAASGALTPYFTIYYQSLGVDIGHIGILVAIPQITLLAANPLWGALADALRLHKRLLPVTMALTLVPVALLMQARSFAALAGLVFIYSLCFAPIIPLADNAVLSMLGFERYQYGRMRVWGAVGWGLASASSGLLIERWGMHLAFVWFMVMMVCAALVATRLPRPRVEGDEPFWSGLRRLSSQPRLYGFLIAVFLAGMTFVIFNNYFILFVTGLGAGEGLFGLSILLAAASEIPIWLLSTRLMERWSPRGLLPLALAFLALRCFFISLLQDPIWALAIQLMHGITFSAMWAAAVSYANEIAPPGLGASVQALYNAVFFGLAGSLGALAGSGVYAAWGPAVLFRLAAAAALAGALIFTFSELRAKAVENGRVRSIPPS